MKKVAILLLITFGIFACSGVLAPDPVHKAFMEKFKDAENIEWEQEGDVWEAEFDLNGKHMEALFNASGEWLETEWEIDLMDLPVGVRDSIIYGYDNYNIEEITRIESIDFTGYEIDLERQSDSLEIEIRATDMGFVNVSEDVDAEDNKDDDSDHDHGDDDSDGHEHDDGDHEHDDGLS